MDTESGKKFSSPQAELKHWRELAQQLKSDLEDVKEEAEEYQISSRELEAELEAQLEAIEERNKDLASTNSKLSAENEALREKLNEMQTTTHRELSEMEADLAQVSAFKDELQRYIRELEQSNDDLERGKRATVASLEEFEGRLNQAIERNAFLESELDEKETLMETVQRLKDEARDLRQEMNVKRRTVKTSESLDTTDINNSCSTPSSTKPVKPIQVVTAVTDPHKLFRSSDSGAIKCETPNVIKSESVSMHMDCGTARMENGGVKRDQGVTQRARLSSGPLLTPISRGGTPTSSFGTTMAPSARISALNIVGDLLRKVGALETKLASCRSYVKEPPAYSRHASDSPQLHSPRTKRRHLNRGASIPQGPASKITA